MKLFRAIRSSIYWSKALQASAREEYSVGLKYIKKCERYTSRKDSEFYLLKSFICYALNQEQSSFEYARTAFLLIDREKIKDNDKQYLRCYIKYMILSMDKVISQQCEDIVNNSYHFNKKNVSLHLLVNFPFPELNST